MGRRWQAPPLGGVAEILRLEEVEEVLGKHSGEEGGSGHRG